MSIGGPHEVLPARVCQLWEVPRSTVYERRARASRPVQPAAKRGPKQAWTDAALTERIRAVLTNSPFLGEGYRKAWARLRLSGVRTSKGRVLRLMREAGLLAPTRVGRRRGPRSHNGTITTERPDEMWGTDATACLTTREGNATVFIAVDHCTQECVGIHAARPGPTVSAQPSVSADPMTGGVCAPIRRMRPGRDAAATMRHAYRADSAFDAEAQLLALARELDKTHSASRSACSLHDPRGRLLLRFAGSGIRCGDSVGDLDQALRRAAGSRNLEDHFAYRLPLLEQAFGRRPPRSRGTRSWAPV